MEPPRPSGTVERNLSLRARPPPRRDQQTAACSRAGASLPRRSPAAFCSTPKPCGASIAAADQLERGLKRFIQVGSVRFPGLGIGVAMG